VSTVGGPWHDTVPTALEQLKLGVTVEPRW
jgi:hypothetical protein